MRYRKKPIEIDAIRWTGANVDQIREFVGRDLPDTRRLEPQT